MLKKDQQISDYVLIERLGAGGFGEVWKAEKRTVLSTGYFAIKFFRAKDEEQINLDTIKQEIGIWQTLNGLPHIISVIEGNQYDDYVYVVSEFADGASLEKWLAKNGGRASSEAEAVAIAAQILKGLEVMHNEGFVHRDLKPANVLIKRNVIYLADFGISRQMKSHSKSTGTAGTYEYMPPEAFESRPVVSPLTDVWAAGVILQKLLTGSLPFPQEDIPSLMGAIIMREPEAMPETISPELREVVKKSLQKNREDRFQTAREMYDALQNAQRLLAASPVSVETMVPEQNLKRGEQEEKPHQNQTIEEKTRPSAEQATISLTKKMHAANDSEKTHVLTPETILQKQSEKSNDSPLQTEEIRKFASQLETDRRPAKSKLGLVSIIAGVALVGLLILAGGGALAWNALRSRKDAHNSIDLDTPAQKPEKSLQDYLDQARNCRDKKDFDCAIENYSAALKLNPGSKEALENRGLSRIDKGDQIYTDNLDKNFRRGKAANYTDEQLQQTDHAQIKNNYDAALEDFGQAIKLDPNSSVYYVDRGNAFYKLIEYMAYNESNGIDEAYLKLRKERYEQALENYNKAIELNSDYAEAYYGRAVNYEGFYLGFPPIVGADLKKAVALNPRFDKALLMLSEYYYYKEGGGQEGNREDLKAAFKYLSQAIDLAPDNREYYERRIMYWREQNRNDLAVKDETTLIELYPDDPETYCDRGDIYANMKAFDKAKADFSKGLELNPHSVLCQRSIDNMQSLIKGN